MTIAEKIYKVVQRLPAPIQAEVLDFVDFVKSRKEDLSDAEWKDFSLSSSMKGMEDESGPEYTTKDLKEKFQ